LEVELEYTVGVGYIKAEAFNLIERKLMQTAFHDYCDDKNTYEGYLAFDETKSSKRPCILVFHAWGGQGDFDRKQADDLATLGYVAFAVDLYGKGKRAGDGPNKMEVAQQLMTPFIEDRALLRDHLTLALGTVQKLPQVDAENIGAMGFCFGGLCALDMARAGMSGVKAAVSLHGNLSTNHLENTKNITAKILIAHGYADPMVTHDAMNAVMDELTAAEADWQMMVLGDHTMHGFTVPENNMPEKGLLYQPVNTRRALKSAQNLFAEAFV
jgi:dienelactone hydrolase